MYQFVRNSVFFAFTILLSNCNAGYHEAQPVSWDGNQLKYVPMESMPDGFEHNLIQVLNYYREPFKIDPKTNHILIKSSLFQNKELLWNYTIKANDQNWLNEHQP